VPDAKKVESLDAENDLGAAEGKKQRATGTRGFIGDGTDDITLSLVQCG